MYIKKEKLQRLIKLRIGTSVMNGDEEKQWLGWPSAVRPW